MNDTVTTRPVHTSEVLEQAAVLLGQGADSALYRAVLNSVIQIAGAEQASLLTPGSVPGELQAVTSQDATGQSRDIRATDLPMDVALKALAEDRVQFTRSATGRAQELFVPLRSGGRVVGLLYASQLERTLEGADLSLLKSLANLAAAALDRADLEAAREVEGKARREFVSLTTHQLRVPLTSISGYTDLMLSGIAGPLTERQEQFMRTVQRNVQRMSQLIADLSDLNRIQDGRLPVKIAQVDLKALIQAVLEEQAERLEAQGLDLQLQVPDGMPAARSDEPSIRRVFEKILDNAIRYTPEGGSLTVGIVHHDQLLQVTVADDGIGIGEEDQTQLYVPFFRSEAETVREHAGWGLSLALAKALLQQLEGDLWCESELGAGAAFHFTLPVGSATEPGNGASLSPVSSN